MAIRRIFAVFAYVAIFKSNKKTKLFILFSLQLFEPIHGRVLERRMKNLVFFCLEYQHMQQQENPPYSLHKTTALNIQIHCRLHQQALRSCITGMNPAKQLNNPEDHAP